LARRKKQRVSSTVGSTAGSIAFSSGTVGLTGVTLCQEIEWVRSRLSKIHATANY
jgi:acyl-CoA synthetase (NDP forming)